MRRRSLVHRGELAEVEQVHLSSRSWRFRGVWSLRRAPIGEFRQISNLLPRNEATVEATSPESKRGDRSNEANVEANSTQLNSTEDNAHASQRNPRSSSRLSRRYAPTGGGEFVGQVRDHREAAQGRVSRSRYRSGDPYKGVVDNRGRDDPHREAHRDRQPTPAGVSYDDAPEVLDDVRRSRTSTPSPPSSEPRCCRARLPRRCSALVAADFGNPRLASVYAAIGELHRQGAAVDALTVADALCDLGPPGLEMRADLIGLQSNTPAISSTPATAGSSRPTPSAGAALAGEAAELANGARTESDPARRRDAPSSPRGYRLAADRRRSRRPRARRVPVPSRRAARTVGDPWPAARVIGTDHGARGRREIYASPPDRLRGRRRPSSPGSSPHARSSR